MYGKKLCMGLGGSFGLQQEEQVHALRKIGFEGFFVNWQKGVDMGKYRKLADSEGMLLQSVHAPYTKMDRMWYPDDMTQPAIDEQIECLRACADAGVPLMIMHAFIGFTRHEPTAAGVDSFGAVVREAEKLGVDIAFENTEGEEYLAALMDAFKGNGNVGFCWDSGHEMCYNRSRDMLVLYGDRLLGTHLNDNLGIRAFDGNITYIDDLHLLPFDGVADWDDNAARLVKCGFDGPLTFELTRTSKPGRFENDVYLKLSPVEYLTEAYKRACRAAVLVVKHENRAGRM